MQSLVTQPPPCTYTHTHTHMHAGTRMHTHMRTHTHAHTHTHTHTLLYSSPCEHMIVQEVHPHQHTCGVDNITNYHSVHRDNWAIQPMYSHTPDNKGLLLQQWLPVCMCCDSIDFIGAHRLVFNQNYMHQPLYHIGSITSVNQPLFFCTIRVFP